MSKHLCTNCLLAVLIMLAWACGAAAGAEPLLGAAKFVPTAERPIGWRGDGTGLYPGATPPTAWERSTTSALGELKCRGQRPGEAEGSGGSQLEYANGTFYVTEMLVIGPWPSAGNTKDTTYLPDEAALAPNGGDTADGKTWTKSTGQFAYLRELYKQLAKGGNAAYVATYVYAPAAQSANLRLGGQMDLNKCYWNGAAVDNNGVVALKKGWNRLVCRINERWDGWAISIGFFEKAAKSYTQKNIAWTTPMPAMSNATPVIVGEKLFTTSEPNDLLCVEKNTGQVLWMRSTPLYYVVAEKAAAAKDEGAALRDVLARLKPVAEKLETLTTACVQAPGKVKNDERAQLQKQLTEDIRKADGAYRVPFGWGGGASGPTPITDGQRVYAWFGETGVLTCFDLEGQRQWARFFGGNGDEHGINASPALAGNVIVIFGGHVTYGIDKKTGEMLWKNPSPTRCYASPIITTIGDVPVGINPDGSVYRTLDGAIISPPLSNPQWDGECASPVLDGRGNFYLVSRAGFGKATLPATADGKTKVTMAFYLKPRDVFPLSDLYIVNSPAVFDGLCYFAYGGSGFGRKEPFLFAIDTQSGRVVYRQPLPIHPDAYYGPNGGGICASMTIAGGKYLYVLDNGGNCAVVAPGREFKLIASNSMANLQNGSEQEVFQASPVFEGDRLYLRGFRNLYCISARAKAAP